MSYQILVLVCVVCVMPAAEFSFADPPADKAVKKELAKLEGTWELILPEGSKDTGMQLEFKKGKLTAAKGLGAFLPRFAGATA